MFILVSCNSRAKNGANLILVFLEYRKFSWTGDHKYLRDRYIKFVCNISGVSVFVAWRTFSITFLFSLLGFRLSPACVYLGFLAIHELKMM